MAIKPGLRNLHSCIFVGSHVSIVFFPSSMHLLVMLAHVLFLHSSAVQGIEHAPNLEITKNPDAKDLASPNQELASDDCSNDAYHVHQELPSIDLAATANASGTISSFAGLKPLQSQNESRKVAFISVGKSAPSVADDCASNKKMKSEMQPENAANPDDPFLSLLLAGNTNKSLF